VAKASTNLATFTAEDNLLRRPGPRRVRGGARRVDGAAGPVADRLRRGAPVHPGGRVGDADRRHDRDGRRALFPASGGFPANNVSPVLATIDPSQTYSLFLSCACSASNALNLINCQIFKVYLEN
jgi:hypothetical protein